MTNEIERRARECIEARFRDLSYRGHDYSNGEAASLARWATKVISDAGLLKDPPTAAPSITPEQSVPASEHEQLIKQAWTLTIEDTRRYPLDTLRVTKALAAALAASTTPAGQRKQDSLRELTVEVIAGLTDDEVVRVCEAGDASQSRYYLSGRDALFAVRVEADEMELILRRAANDRAVEYARGDLDVRVRVGSDLDEAVRWAYCAQAHPEVLSEAEYAALTGGWRALR